MGSLQLAHLLSCKACPILLKLGPSHGFRSLRQVGFGSLWRNRTQYGCLMARSSANVGGGSSNQERSSAVENENEKERSYPLEIGKSEVSESKQENDGDIIKNQLLDNQLEEIIVELRKNNEEIIKKLQEKAQKSWKRVRAEVDQKSLGQKSTGSNMLKVAQDAVQVNRKEQVNAISENETPKETQVTAFGGHHSGR